MIKKLILYNKAYLFKQDKFFMRRITLYIILFIKNFTNHSIPLNGRQFLQVGILQHRCKFTANYLLSPKHLIMYCFKSITKRY